MTLHAALVASWVSLAVTIIALALAFGVTAGLILIIVVAWSGGVVTQRLAQPPTSRRTRD